jgi:nucleoside-diphosphate-sugar epimerase
MTTDDSQSFTLPADAPVLVTGATGFTGHHLVGRLLECGAKVRATARESSSLDAFRGMPIEWRVGTLHDEAYVRDAVRGVEYVFHLASNYRQTYGSAQEHQDIHVVSTQHLARAAAAEASFKRFVHVSSVGVHGHIEHPPASETHPFAPGDIYQRSKLEGEQWLLRFAREHGLPAVVVRPAAIYGPGDRRLFKVFKMATWRVVPLVGFGPCLYHLIHVDDLVDFMLLIARHEAALGEAFICAGPEPISIKTFVQYVGAYYGVRNRFVRVPATPLVAAAVVCDRVCRVLRVQPPLYPRRVAFFTKDRAFDTSKMEQVLGFRARRGNEEGIVETAKWYVEQGWIDLEKGASS